MQDGRVTGLGSVLANVGGVTRGGDEWTGNVVTPSNMLGRLGSVISRYARR